MNLTDVANFSLDLLGEKIVSDIAGDTNTEKILNRNIDTVIRETLTEYRWTETIRAVELKRKEPTTHKYWTEYTNPDFVGPYDNEKTYTSAWSVVWYNDIAYRYVGGMGAQGEAPPSDTYWTPILSYDPLEENYEEHDLVILNKKIYMATDEMNSGVVPSGFAPGTPLTDPYYSIPTDCLRILWIKTADDKLLDFTYENGRLDLGDEAGTIKVEYIKYENNPDNWGSMLLKAIFYSLAIRVCIHVTKNYNMRSAILEEFEKLVLPRCKRIDVWGSARRYKYTRRFTYNRSRGYF